MKIAVDLNVLLDVAQNRAQFYQDSEEELCERHRSLTTPDPRDLFVW